MAIELKTTTSYFVDEYPEIPFPTGLITDEYPFAVLVRLEQYNDEGEFHPFYILKLAKEKFYLHKDGDASEVKCDVVDYTGYIVVPSADVVGWIQHHKNSSTNYWGEVTETQYPIWANHDVIDVSTNEVFVQKSSTEPKIITTTTTAPDIPEGYEQYPHALVISAMGMFLLLYTDEPLYLFPSGDFDVVDFLDEKGNAIAFMLDGSTEVQSWVKESDEIIDGSAAYPVGTINGQTYEIAWANYDILTADSDEIYFPNSEKPSLPPYLCESSDWYKAVANEIRRISGNYASFEFNEDAIEKALYGGIVSPKTIIEGSYTRIVIPETVNVNNPYIFDGCDMLQFVDLGKANQIHVRTLFAYGNNGKLDTLILRSDTVVTVNGITGTSWIDYPLYGTQIEKGEGYIYVPSALVDSYKNDSVNHWSEYADQFRAIEDYPDICGSL